MAAYRLWLAYRGGGVPVQEGVASLPEWDMSPYNPVKDDRSDFTQPRPLERDMPESDTGISPRRQHTGYTEAAAYRLWLAYRGGGVPVQEGVASLPEWGR